MGEKGSLNQGAYSSVFPLGPPLPQTFPWRAPLDSFLHALDLGMNWKTTRLLSRSPVRLPPHKHIYHRTPEIYDPPMGTKRRPPLGWGIAFRDASAFL